MEELVNKDVVFTYKGRLYDINHKNLDILVKAKLAYLKKNKIKSPFLKVLKVNVKWFKIFILHIQYKAFLEPQKKWFNHKHVDRRLNIFWKLYWYNLAVYIKLNFVFDHLMFKNKLVDWRKAKVLHTFLKRELVFVKWSSILQYISKKTFESSKKASIYKYYYNNYYNFFNLPVLGVIERTERAKALAKLPEFKDKNSKVYKKFLKYKKNLLPTFNALLSFFTFIKNKDLYEFELMYFKYMNYDYRFLSTRRYSDWSSLNRSSVLYIDKLVLRYTKLLLIPFDLDMVDHVFASFLKGPIIGKVKSKVDVRGRVKKKFFLKKKRQIFSTKREFILKVLAAKKDINLQPNTFILFLRKTFSNTFITLTDLNLKVIVCQTSTIAGITGNKRRKTAPQAIEYIVNSLLKHSPIKRVYLCMNIRSNIKKYTHILLRELQINNIDVQGIFRFCIRAHNGVRGRTSKKKI